MDAAIRSSCLSRSAHVDFRRRRTLFSLCTSDEDVTPVLLELDDDQRLWRLTVEEAVAKQCPPSLVRVGADGEDAGDDLWQWYCDQGWTELNSAECFVELALVL